MVQFLYIFLAALHLVCARTSVMLPNQHEPVDLPATLAWQPAAFLAESIGPIIGLYPLDHGFAF